MTKHYMHDNEQPDVDLLTFTKCDVFTPANICEMMTSKLTNHGSLLEPSVGNGHLLEFIDVDNYDSIDVYELKSSYLFGINNAKINKINADFVKATICKKYDNIVMNPPYIRIQDLSVSYRDYIKTTFPELETAMFDIYYVFIIKCLKLLRDGGTMVAIIPSAYLHNKSAYGLRKYLFSNRYVKEVIDFGDKKIFSTVSTYCCITIFTKKHKSILIYNGRHIKYGDINRNYSVFDFNTGNNTLKSVCKITNGLATLRDNIYVHTKKLYNEPCWKCVICNKNVKYIIFPYENGKIIPKNIFKKNNPNTYGYLKKHKSELEERDKGRKTYATWYAYGRTQSITPPSGKCIFIR